MELSIFSLSFVNFLGLLKSYFLYFFSCGSSSAGDAPPPPLFMEFSRASIWLWDNTSGIRLTLLTA